MSPPIRRRATNPYIAFTTALRRARTASRRWHAIHAGHFVLECAEKCVLSSRHPHARAPGTVDALRQAVAAVACKTTRLHLTRLIDSLAFRPVVDTVLTAMRGYGRHLHHIGCFDLAIAVHSRIIDCAGLASSFDLATAYRELGYCLREMGQFGNAERVFVLGTEWATRRGDLRGVLHLTIARATMLIMVHRLNEAELLLDTALSDAESAADWEVIARAAHTRGNVAVSRDDWMAALQFHERAWRAAEMWARSGEEGSIEYPSRILGDIALALYRLGLHDDARIVCSMLLFTAPEKEVRWAATINLVSIAAAGGRSEAFHQHLTTLARAPLPARLKIALLEEIADGYTKFGTLDRAHAAYEAMGLMARRHKLAAAERRAYSALRGAPEDRSRWGARRTDVPPEIIGLVEELRRLGELSRLIASVTRRPRRPGRQLTPVY